MILMLLEMSRGLLAMWGPVGQDAADQNPYLAFSRWRLLVSDLLPVVWLRVWFSDAVRVYITRISGR